MAASDSVRASKQQMTVTIDIAPVGLMGTSFAGFSVASAIVATAWNPVYAMERTADVLNMPRKPKGAIGERFLWVAMERRCRWC